MRISCKHSPIKNEVALATSFLLFPALIECRIDGIDVFLIHGIFCHVQGITETLIVHDLPLSEEFQRIAHVGIVNQAEQIVISDSRLLLCCTCASANFLEIPVNLDGHVPCALDALADFDIIDQFCHEFPI